MQNEKHFRYRASFQKRGESRLLTHLQLVRTIRRAINNAEIPITRSGGANGEPQIAFGPALPMNVESMEEFLDFYCWRYAPPAELIRRINACLSPDLVFLDATQISRSAKALSELIDGADYLVDLNGLPQQAWQEAIHSFHVQNEIEVVKHKTGKVLNLKDYVKMLSHDQTNCHLHVEMKIVEGRTIGIHSAIQKLFSTDRELPIVRERLYLWVEGEKRSPLTLEWEQRQLQLHLLDLMT